MSKYAAYGIALIHNGTEVAQVTNISGPSLSLDTADVTEHDGDGWEEVVGTILRTGTLTFEIVYDPIDATHIAVIAGLTGKTLESFEVWFPDDDFTAWAFDAYVTGVSPSAPVGDALKASITLKPSGEMSLTETYSL